MRIVLTGGGTGGHLVPLISVAKKIREKAANVKFLFLGPKGEIEIQHMMQANIPMKKISVGKIRRYFSFLNFLDFFKVVMGFFQSLYHLVVFMPDVVFSKGGYASFPVVLAAWAYQIPVLIHESDSKPGLANSILAKFAKRVAVSYVDAERAFPSAKVILTGNPLREDIAQGNAQNIKQMLNMADFKKIIFVYGGSQGAKIINDKITNILPELLKKYFVIHQTGKNNFEEVKEKVGELGIKSEREGYFPIAYVGDELKDILAAADLVISRAGANSISEIAANGKASILIPLENSAGDHQKINAYTLDRVGGCVVLEENNLGENLLLSRIDELMNNEELRKKLGENIRVFYHPDAAEKIAKGVVELALN